ncbi:MULTISPECIES: CbtB domain-containing protein [unclassified Roseovarius]|uniref:CbtB domain-containing protein n=1 Tax=unclassified Roseovarius TaxID=2614913 RepID=UPI0020CDF064|nr:MULTISPECIES: CbtB domain-containing protein [unclassified Roseovarius]MCQ0094235.1 CbtB-domain containing protein [Roseovarius sp. M141]
MTTLTQVQGQSHGKLRADILPALFAAVLGLAIITLTGHVQASALHDAAHDVRHATGFPCH